MIAWILANLGTVFVCALVLAGVGFAVRSLVMDRKRGKSPCGCSCSGCGGCHCGESAPGGGK